MLVVAVIGSPHAGGRTRVAAAFAEGGGALRDEPRQLAELHGRALAELAAAVASSRWLRTMRAQI